VPHRISISGLDHINYNLKVLSDFLPNLKYELEGCCCEGGNKGKASQKPWITM
jgi:hypothetical protein